MRVNADFSCRVIVAADQHQWLASPQRGVERVMLDRVGEEKARATSLVRYAPGTWFPRHHHPGGEEILVLSGTFSDETGHYPAGWYLRNPPGSSHRPFSDEGTLIFVKLWQMPADEGRHVQIDTRDPASWVRRHGREICPLFSSDTEQVCLHRVAARQAVFTAPTDSAELLILDGELIVDDRSCGRGAWLRLPVGDCSGIAAGAQGATFYLKTGHLAEPAGEA